jgi:tetratricopeptide (TPR) repeat protein
MCFTSRMALAVAIAASAFTALADELTDRAKVLLARKDAKAAYALLLRQEGRRAGDPEYDYLLGVAALDSGEYERAVFALERVLAVQPNNHVARAEIARAFLAMGERDSARREFETVRQQTIPPEAKASIERYLAAIAASETTQIAGFVEFGVGSDSNVNSATDSPRGIALPRYKRAACGKRRPADSAGRNRHPCRCRRLRRRFSVRNRCRAACAFASALPLLCVDARIESCRLHDTRPHSRAAGAPCPLVGADCLSAGYLFSLRLSRETP